MCTSSMKYKEFKIKFVPITKDSGIKVKDWVTGKDVEFSKLLPSSDDLNFNNNVRCFNFEKRTLPDGTEIWYKI